MAPRCHRRQLLPAAALRLKALGAAQGSCAVMPPKGIDPAARDRRRSSATPLEHGWESCPRPRGEVQTLCRGSGLGAVITPQGVDVAAEHCCSHLSPPFQHGWQSFPATCARIEPLTSSQRLRPVPTAQDEGNAGESAPNRAQRVGHGSVRQARSRMQRVPSQPTHRPCCSSIQPWHLQNIGQSGVHHTRVCVAGCCEVPPVQSCKEHLRWQCTPRVQAVTQGCTLLAEPVYLQRVLLDEPTQPIQCDTSSCCSASCISHQCGRCHDICS
mmetsp:Transcript_47154/g.109020  ORF Transcript_47154/g.109020 Transcript_47154/m.109020 type:complete len:270 (-) Transcript_47154:6-815(-)